MNRNVALPIGALIGALTLMTVDLAFAGAPEGASAIRSEQAGALGAGTYQGFRPAVPGMVHALEAGRKCHDSGHCSDWVAKVIQANNAAPSQSQNSWGARMSARIRGSLQPIAKTVGARIERVACSEQACFAEATYAKSGRTGHQIVAIDDQLRTAISGSGWAQSELEVTPSLHGLGGFLYEGPSTNPLLDVIWVWPRK